MPGTSAATLIRQLRRIASVGGNCGLGDRELVCRWVESHDQAAFEVILWRHGPTVLNVCRRVLREAQDIEDAFQATFLTFIRKAGSLREGAVVGGWLYKVAYRIAIRAGAGKRGMSVRQDRFPWLRMKACFGVTFAPFSTTKSIACHGTTGTLSFSVACREKRIKRRPANWVAR